MADEKRTGDHIIELDDKQPNGQFQAAPRPAQPAMAASPAASQLANNPVVSILGYCVSSILMTVANKYVVNGRAFNLNFFLLAVQVSGRVYIPWLQHTDIDCSHSSAY